MSDQNKWGTSDEEMDEDSVMEEEELDDMEEESHSSVHAYGGANVYTRNDFGRFDAISIASPSHPGFGEGADEKGDSMGMLMHHEKTVVHKDFHDKFDDDFDEEDLA